MTYPIKDSYYDSYTHRFVAGPDDVKGEVRAHVMGILGLPAETPHSFPDDWFEEQYKLCVPQAYDIHTTKIMTSKSTLDIARDYVAYVGADKLRELIDHGQPGPSASALPPTLPAPGSVPV